MPNIPRIAISKKIESAEERARLKTIVKGALPEGMGAIIRTTCENKTDREILKDLEYLIDTWQEILNKYKNAPVKAKVYEDIDISLQAVRDNLDDEVDAVITDSRENHSLIYKFIKSTAPDQIAKVKFYDGKAKFI